MELTPNKRYHSVTEFARDLRRVARALPIPPPSTSSRSADPNSTQPNFQEVFDTLQAQVAKEQVNNKQDHPGSATPPLAQETPVHVLPVHGVVRSYLQIWDRVHCVVLP